MSEPVSGLASRLALIDPAVAKALHALRGVRNDFAHSAADTSLAAPTTANAGGWRGSHRRLEVLL